MEYKELALSDIAYLPIDMTSHTLPFLGFLSELDAHGLNFDVYGPPTQIKKALGPYGQNHFEFPELVINKEEGWNAMLKSAYESHLKTVPAIEALWEKSKKKPKLMIADMVSAYAKLLAKKHGIPLMVFFSTYFIGNLTQPLEESTKATLGLRDESLAGLDQELEEKCQISIKSLKDILITGDYNISCIPKFIGDLVTDEKEFFEYLGPALREESVHEELDIYPGFLKDKDIIYVSLGTTPQDKTGFSYYDSIVEAFRNTEHKVLISAVFGKAEELTAKGLPKNIIVKSWVPQLKVLEHSKLFITHAGAGGMMESLSFAVPMIAVPNFGDQPLNAGVIEKLNIGRWLKDHPPENIKKVTEEILGDKNIKAACLKAKDTIDLKSAKGRFTEIVRSLIN